MTIHDTNVEIIRILDEWGWLGKELPETPPAQETEPTLVGGIHKFKEGS